MRLPPVRHRPVIKAAADLVAALGIRAPAEIDIELIAAHCGAIVEYKPLTTEEGRLLRIGSTGLIVVNTDARRTAKWRFVVAHELGHFRCHQQLDQLGLCTDESLHEWYQASGYEPEANRFAAELLMPEVLFKKACDVKRPSLNVVRQLATSYNTSLTATALRFVEFSPEPVALVVCREGRIAWFSKGDDFKIFLSKGQRVANATYAADLLAGREVPEDIADVAVDAWSSGQFPPAVELYEQSTVVGQYGDVVTLLWHSGLGQEDDDDRAE